MEPIESWAEIGLLYLNNTRHIINNQCSDREAWEIIMSTALFMVICNWLHQQVFLHELSVFERMKLSFFKILRRLPVIGRKMEARKRKIPSHLKDFELQSTPKKATKDAKQTTKSSKIPVEGKHAATGKGDNTKKAKNPIQKRVPSKVSETSAATGSKRQPTKKSKDNIILGIHVSSDDLVRVKDLRQARMDKYKKLISDLQVTELQDMLFRCLEKNQGMVIDLLEQLNKRKDDPEPSEQPKNPKVPEWCICSHCREMNTDLERLCCNMRPEFCLSQEEIQEELDKTKSAITKDMFPLPQGDKYNTHLPEKGIPKDELLKLVASKYKSMEKIDWQGGRLSGAVYNCGAEHESLMERIYGIFVGDNLLHPDVFPGTRKMEAEVVAMCCNFFHGGPEACGTMTSGGTESILMACKAYREHAYKRGIKHPEILAPCSGHAAFAKAAKYFKMRYVESPIDPTTKLINIPAMRRKISKNTCMLVVSAPSFPYGVVEQVEEVGKLGKQYNIPVHVDACMGGFIIPFAQRAGINLPPMDFRVEGVTSISADAHKYGLAPKGNSIVVYKNPEYRMGQFYINTDWCGGIYASPAVGGTRSGAIIATCWATMMYVGADGYQENAVKIIKTREYVEDCVRKIPGLTVQGKPDVNILSISSDTFDIYRLGAALTNKGWHMFTVQYPAGVNFCVTKMHTLPGVAERFVKDLEECTAVIMKNPDAKADGIAAIYGMAESIPDRSMVAEFVQGYLEAYYSTKL